MTKDASFADVEVVTVDTQEYWEIDNPVDGGGVSFVLVDEGETPPDPGDPPPVDPPVDPPPVDPPVDPPPSDPGDDDGDTPTTPTTPTTNPTTPGTLPVTGEGDSVEEDLQIVEQTEEYGDNEVDVCWKTNKKAKGKVKYGVNKGKNTNYKKEIKKDKFEKEHCVTLTPIEEDEDDYRYQIIAEDEEGETATLEKEVTIIELEPVDNEAGDVISIVDTRKSETEEDTYEIEYETRYPSYCSVSYGPNSEELDYTYSSGVLGTEHLAYLTIGTFPEDSDIYYLINCEAQVAEGEEPQRVMKSGSIGVASVDKQEVDKPLLDLGVDLSLAEAATAILIAVGVLFSGLIVAVYPNSILYAIGWLRSKKKLRPWGIVFDREENKPVAFAVVELWKNNQLVQRAVTDMEGRYMLPVEKGNYKLIAKQTGYEELVETLTVDSPRSTNIDLGLTKTGNTPLLYSLRRVLPRLNMYVFTLGLLVSIVITAFYFNWVNVIVVVFYLVQVITWVLLRPPKSIGYVYDSQTGKRVQGVIVKIHDPETLGLKDSQMTNEEGRYGTILEAGKYKVSVTNRGYTIDGVKAQRGYEVDAQASETYVVVEIQEGEYVDIAIPLTRKQTTGFGQ